MHKRLLLGLFVCMPVSLPLKGGIGEKLKLWRQQKKIETLEKKGIHPFQLQRMNSKKLKRHQRDAQALAERLRPSLLTLHESKEEKLYKRAKKLSKAFRRALADRHVQKALEDKDNSDE